MRIERTACSGFWNTQATFSGPRDPQGFLGNTLYLSENLNDLDARTF